jgi:hypothetical protein
MRLSNIRHAVTAFISADSERKLQDCSRSKTAPGDKFPAPFDWRCGHVTFQGFCNDKQRVQGIGVALTIERDPIGLSRPWVEKIWSNGLVN